ncbi:chemotaxis protein CheW [Phormidesmis priestleyi]|nr:chemotaxis protein CheW [Phormidesmis priestleyi]
MNDCWNQIGVWGDRSCSQLETVTHCRNCPVYSTAGRSLLERDIPLDYLNEWMAAIATPANEVINPSDDRPVLKGSADPLSVILFRLGDEQFALPVSVLHEVTHPGAIHRLPHRSNDVFLGLINIRGEILMTISLSQFLGLKSVTDSSSLNRLLVVGHDDRKWVFPVDEVHRIHRVQASELKEVPVVVSQASQAYTQGIIDWQTKKVNYLDADLLFYTLERSLL